jgi:sugar/nucleoside kinase (ribokinase family)
VIPVGVFVGLATLDLVLGVERLPGPDEKIVATSQLVAAGGPATNAAVAFAWAGGRPRLLTALGRHPLARVVGDDLRARGVSVRDAVPDRAEPPPMAAILLTEATGERAVVSPTDRTHGDPGLPADVDSIDRLLAGARVVVADGHHAGLAEPLLTAARELDIPVILDAGSWRPSFATLLPLGDVVVASAAFRPPGIPSEPDAVLADLLARGPSFVARTAGAGPIRWRDGVGARGAIEVAAVEMADTLGAGDILHGVMAAVIAARPRGGSRASELIVEALLEGSRVATAACAHRGTRAWLAAGIRRPLDPAGPA